MTEPHSRPFIPVASDNLSVIMKGKNVCFDPSTMDLIVDENISNPIPFSPEFCETKLDHLPYS